MTAVPKIESPVQGTSFVPPPMTDLKDTGSFIALVAGPGFKNILFSRISLGI